MTADQIGEWANKGIEFGAHGRTHLDLTALSDKELDDEVAGSAADLAALLGSQASCVAYPFGPFDERVCRRIQKHFQAGFTAEKGLNSLRTDLMRLKRSIVFGSNTFFDLLCHLHFGSSPWQRFKWRVIRRARAKDHHGPAADVAKPRCENGGRESK